MCRSDFEEVAVRISNKRFWKSVEEAAAEVRKWPQWKRAGVIAYRDSTCKPDSCKCFCHVTGESQGRCCGR